MVFGTTILGSNPSAPANTMIKITSTNIFKSLKSKLFPFYKSKEIKMIFNILKKDETKNNVAMFVGGCVRKFLKNQEIDDIDIATIFSPEEIKKKFENTDIKVIDTGIEHGTVTLILNNSKFEITTLRKDLKTDGRHAEVAYSDNWREDSNRRDFTINAIYINENGKIFDPQLGVKDLKNNLVKFIGDPLQRIEEDYLRILRFIRFVLEYGSTTEKTTLNAIKLNLIGIKKISKERILSELFKFLKIKQLTNLIKNKELFEIFIKIFPEFKYLPRLEKSEKINTLDIDKELLISIILVDETNNHEYFCHKYAVSNVLKKKLEINAKLYKEYLKNNFLFKKELKKSVFLYDKENIKNLNLLLFFVGKLKYNEYLNYKNLIDKINVPKFPYDGNYLIKKGVEEGKAIGRTLKKIKHHWLENNFEIREEELEKIIINSKN